MTATEQRAHPRVPLVLQVQYPELEGFLVDATENLSAAGAFVRTDRPLTTGDTVPLALSFPGLLAPLQVVGVVVWVRPAGPDSPRGVGLRIPEERIEDRRALADLVRMLRAEARPTLKPIYRVLLVEDNPHIMEMYEYVIKKLSRSDHLPLEVALAREGHVALAKLQSDRFDLVITDLYMPVLDGFQLIRKMRELEHTRDVPVVAISGGGNEAALLAKQAGANVFLRKPVRFVDVMETVRALLKL